MRPYEKQAYSSMADRDPTLRVAYRRQSQKLDSQVDCRWSIWELFMFGRSPTAHLQDAFRITITLHCDFQGRSVDFAQVV